MIMLSGYLWVKKLLNWSKRANFPNVLRVPTKIPLGVGVLCPQLHKAGKSQVSVIGKPWKVVTYRTKIHTKWGCICWPPIIWVCTEVLRGDELLIGLFGCFFHIQPSGDHGAQLVIPKHFHFVSGLQGRLGIWCLLYEAQDCNLHVFGPVMVGGVHMHT